MRNEIAIGPETRSMLRWVRRAALPIVFQRVTLMVALTFALLLFGRFYWALIYEPHACTGPAAACEAMPNMDRDLLDLIF